ncbi:MAG: hypothetical protein ACRD3Q_03835 [Terriglobales bacterium]
MLSIPQSESNHAFRSMPMERSTMALDYQLERAIPLKELLDSMRGWHKRLSPRFGRACSAGKLLFQVIGIAGYAGYFASMHALMRVASGALVAGTWYAIYKMKSAAQN